MHHLHPLRQRGFSLLPRYSNATPRAISAARTTSSARYSAENIVAYQPGNAANVAAPATTSHTSLPSHQAGPIVLSATRRSVSVRPTIVCSIPTPKSNPSEHEEPDPEDRHEHEPDGVKLHSDVTSR